MILYKHHNTIMEAYGFDIEDMPTKLRKPYGIKDTQMEPRKIKDIRPKLIEPKNTRMESREIKDIRIDTLNRILDICPELIVRKRELMRHILNEVDYILESIIIDDVTYYRDEMGGIRNKDGVIIGIYEKTNNDDTKHYIFDKVTDEINTINNKNKKNMSDLFINNGII